jgi:hypothetical protein
MKKEIKSLNMGQLIKSNEKWQYRVLVATPMTGLIRAEWHNARMCQIIPTAWSQVIYSQFMSSYIPLEFQVADAYNVICKQLIEKNFEWLLTIESDNVLPQDGFVQMNEYMISEKVPVVSSLYFTKSVPPEPLVYRGVGWGHYDKWKFGDKVWALGIPMGFTLIHASIIRAMWNESEEYTTGGVTTRRIFETPNAMKYEDEAGGYVARSGTQDLAWCQRVMKGNFFAKAGWPEYQKKQYPFLVDTNIFVKHITMDGIQYPIVVPPKFIPPKGYKPKTIN